MSKDILKKTISEDVDNAVLEQIAVLRERLEGEYANLLNEALDGIERQRQEMDKRYRRKLKALRSRIEEEYEREYERRIAQTEAAIERKIRQLGEKVDTFLRNSREEIYRLVTEEVIRNAGNHPALKLQRIKALLEGVETASPTDNARLAQLESDVERLKERVEAKDRAIQKLKAKLRVYEILEEVPEPDREYYEVLFEEETPEDVEREYRRVRRLVETKQKQEAKPQEPRSRTQIDERDLGLAESDFWQKVKWLSGIKDKEDKR